METNTGLFSRLFVIVLAIKAFDVLKNLLIAYFLGVSDSADVYNSIIIIPDSLIVLFGLDTIRGVVNSEYAHSYGLERKDELWESFRRLFSILLVAGIAVTIVALILNPLIIGVILPGFEGEKKNAATGIAYVVFPILFFKILSGYFHSVLNSVKSFYLPVIAPALISVLIVFSVMLPSPEGGLIYNLSYANLAGNILLLLIFGYSLKNLGASFRWAGLKPDELTLKVIKASGSIMMLVVFNQIYLFSRNYFASYFGEGAISALHYSGTIPSIVISVIFATFFTAIISKLSTLFSEGKDSEAGQLYRKTILALLFFVIPVVAVFLSSGEELLKLLYLRGEFDLKGIELTMKPYYWDVLALITFVLYILPTAYFLAGKDYKRLTIAGSSVYIAGTVLNYFLTSYLGFYAVSIAHLIITGIYGFILLSMSLPRGEERTQFFKTALMIIAGGAVSFFLVNITGPLIRNVSIAASWQRDLFVVIVNTAVTLAVFLSAMQILRINFAFEFVKGLAKK